MINPEQLLGNMLTSGLGGLGGFKGKKKKKSKLYKKMGMGSGFSSGAKTMLGMGALGVAMAAFDHFVVERNKQGGQSGVMPGSPPGYPPGQGGYQQPYPQQGMPGYTPGGPVHAQPPASTPPPPPPPPPGGASSQPPQIPQTPEANEALLLIRAMIAAANADGAIDADERGQIVDSLQKSGVTDEERNFILQEFFNPPTLDAIVSEVKGPDQARQVYAISYLAIEVDTEAEKKYMADLAQRLSLDQQTVSDIESKLNE